MASDGHLIGYRLPPCYRFRPTDKELIGCYLKRRLLKEEVLIKTFRDVALYSFNPQLLTQMYQMTTEDEWYFFTQRNENHSDESPAARFTPYNGYWKPTGVDVEIEVNEAIIGHKRSLCYYEGNTVPGTRTEWRMYEYRAQDDKFKSDDWVLCKIYRVQRSVDARRQRLRFRPVHRFSDDEI